MEAFEGVAFLTLKSLELAGSERKAHDGYEEAAGEEPNPVRAGVRSCARCGRANELRDAHSARWYIAARFSSKARIVSDVVPRLLELGIAVSSSWLTTEDADEPPDVIAARDLGDIALRSSALVLDMTDGLGRNAMAMGEVGVAHSLGLPVYLVGETGNVLVKAVARRRWLSHTLIRGV